MTGRDEHNEHEHERQEHERQEHVREVEADPEWAAGRIESLVGQVENLRVRAEQAESRMRQMEGANAVARLAGLTPGEAQAVLAETLAKTLDEVSKELDEVSKERDAWKHTAETDTAAHLETVDGLRARAEQAEAEAASARANLEKWEEYKDLAWAADPVLQLERLADFCNGVDLVDECGGPVVDAVIVVLEELPRLVRESTQRRRKVEEERDRLRQRLSKVGYSRAGFQKDIADMCDDVDALREARDDAQAVVDVVFESFWPDSEEGDRVSPNDVVEAIELLRSQRDKARAATGELLVERKELAATILRLKNESDAWWWMGDGTDDLDSMTDALEVRIPAGMLRAIVKKDSA